MFKTKMETGDIVKNTVTDKNLILVELHELFRNGVLIESCCIKTVRYTIKNREWEKRTKIRSLLTYSSKAGKLCTLGLYY